MTSLRALTEAATPAPWKAICGQVYVDSKPLHWPYLHEIDYDENVRYSDADAKLIALAPQLADLLDRFVAWTVDVQMRAIIDNEPDYETMDELLAEFVVFQETLQPGGEGS